jgi:hypothetical protein
VVVRLQLVAADLSGDGGGHAGAERRGVAEAEDQALVELGLEEGRVVDEVLAGQLKLAWP